MSWRLAKSLDTLRSQVNALFPNRDKSNDGTIGDARHAASKSEHNPDANGVVRAMDISHDPDHGVGTYVLAEYLRRKQDPRILYVISNGRIWSSEVSPYKWRAYSGSNKHDHHIHISVVADPKKYDDTKPWDIAFSDTIPDTEPSVIPPAPDGRPELKQGARGVDVEKLQQLLFVDGIFGTKTKAAVKAFQKANGIVADGIVGPETWAKLTAKTQPVPVPDHPPPLDSGNVFHDITASVFGGASDPNRSAYSDKLLDDVGFYVALPYRFQGERPRVQVTNPRNGESVVSTIEDIGPWMINDEYFASDRRPVAEVCHLTRTPLPSGPNKGKVPTNPAGIDLSPALAKRLGIDGLGKVDWKFV